MIRIVQFIFIIVFLTSCTYDYSGNLKFATWFWYALVGIVILFIIALLQGNSEAKKVEESLNQRGLKVSDYKKCGTYVGGHPDIDKTIEGIAIRKQFNKLEINEFPNDLKLPTSIAYIPIDKIIDIKVEDASSIERRLTVGRLLLVGIFAFAWKKKKKNELAFVTIEWKEKFEHDTVFSFEGKEAMQNANTSSNQLIKFCEET